MATYRDTRLKGIISKKRAEHLFDLYTSITKLDYALVELRGYTIYIDYDDFNDLCINVYDTKYKCVDGGEFERI